MPRIQVSDGELTGPDGKKVPVKIIEADSFDGLAASIMIPAESASELAAHLDGRSIQVAQPGDMPEEASKAKGKGKGKSDG